MTTRIHARRAAALFALIAAPFAASAALQEIPITTQSPEARLAFEAGQAALDRGDGQQANDLFRAAVAADPNFTYAWYNLSNVTFSTEEFNTALRGGERGAAQASEGERMLLEFNKLFLDNNFTAQLELAQQADPDLSEFRARLDAAGRRAGGVEPVRRAARHARESDDTGAGILAGALRAGRFVPVQRSHRFRQGRTDYRRAIAIQPGVDMYYWALGDVYRGSNRLEDARRYYQLALQLDPKDLTAPIKLGHVNSFLGNFDEARADYDRGIAAAGPANAGFLAPFKAYTYIYAGDPASAVKALEKLVTDIDGFGRRTGAAAECQGICPDQCRAGRHGARALRRRATHPRASRRADARQRQTGGHAGLRQYPGDADRLLRRTTRRLAR